MSGEEPQELNEKTCPINDLAGFDSLRGVETTCFLETKLEIPIDVKGGVVNLFVSSDGCRAQTIREIATKVLGMTNGE